MEERLCVVFVRRKKGKAKSERIGTYVQAGKSDSKSPGRKSEISAIGNLVYSLYNKSCMLHSLVQRLRLAGAGGQRYNAPLRRTMASNTEGRGHLILVRHGQSLWNVTDESSGLTARFTGWTDVAMTARGIGQSMAAGKALQKFLQDKNLTVDTAFVSLLSRAKHTLKLVLKELQLPGDPTIIESWRLNERHYGALCGMSKVDAEATYGVEKLSRWRNGWDTPPPPMDHDTLMNWRKAVHCQTITKINDGSLKNRFITLKENGQQRSFGQQSSFGELSSFGEPGHELNEAKPNRENWPDVLDAKMPASESLQDTVKRTYPIWKFGLAPRLKRGETVLVAAHANTIRALLFHCDPFVNERNLKVVKIPSAKPLALQFEEGDELAGGLVNVGVSCADTGLTGEWITSNEIEDLSFCTVVGQSALEHEIA